MKPFFASRPLFVTAAFLPLLLTAVVPVHSSAAAEHFENWAPLETLTDSVHISAADSSLQVDGEGSAQALERHMASIAAQHSHWHAAATEGVDWPPKMKLSGAELSTLLPEEEQHYVQFATRVNDVTAAVFESLTGRPLLSMVADRAFVAVGSSAWAQRARAFPGVFFVTVRGHDSKVSAMLCCSERRVTRERLAAGCTQSTRAAAQERRARCAHPGLLQQRH